MPKCACMTGSLPNRSWKAGDFLESLNADSLEVVTGKLEPLAELSAGERVQFERLGYFTPDAKDTVPDKPVFNRIVGLRDIGPKLRTIRSRRDAWVLIR